MEIGHYQALRALSRRLSRRTQDADDLLQDALLAGLERGRDDPAWLAGVIRNQAAMTARTAARRRGREAAVANDDTTAFAGVDEPAADSGSILRALPPAARQVAVLALHGLGAEEIRWILQLSPTAFRQRLTSIRKAIGALPPGQRTEALALAYVRDPERSAELQFGLMRRALHAVLRVRGGLGTHDQDGHLIVIAAHARPVPGNR